MPSIIGDTASILSLVLTIGVLIAPRVRSYWENRTLSRQARKQAELERDVKDLMMIIPDRSTLHVVYLMVGAVFQLAIIGIIAATQSLAVDDELMRRFWGYMALAGIVYVMWDYRNRMKHHNAALAEATRRIKEAVEQSDQGDEESEGDATES